MTTVHGANNFKQTPQDRKSRSRLEARDRKTEILDLVSKHETEGKKFSISSRSMRLTGRNSRSRLEAWDWKEEILDLVSIVEKCISLCSVPRGIWRPRIWWQKNMRSTWSSRREQDGNEPRDAQTRTFGRRRPWWPPKHNIAGSGKILKLFFLNIHWISIRPQAYLDGHRTFLSKIETFTEVPFIISSTFFVNTEHYPQIDWEVNFSDLLNSQYIVQWKWTECLTVALIRASS